MRPQYANQKWVNQTVKIFVLFFFSNFTLRSGVLRSGYDTGFAIQIVVYKINCTNRPNVPTQISNMSPAFGRDIVIIHIAGLTSLTAHTGVDRTTGHNKST
jgi:hypothetical protein